MRIQRIPWLLRCSRCGLWRSRLDEPGHAGLPCGLAEDHREEGLEGLRRSNFERILDLTAPWLRRSGATVLDVGCGHGWFLAAAARRGLQPTGIEPDPAVVERASSHGHPVRVGSFPECLESLERWDVLSFHDVFEHLGDPDRILDACRCVIAPDGLLLINVPACDGLLYRLAILLARFGRTGPLERLWQKGFPCPHLFYYEDVTLERLLRKHGFALVKRTRLPSIRLSGLWSRVRMDSRAGTATVLAQSLGLIMLFPFLRWIGPSDIMFHIYRPQGT